MVFLEPEHFLIAKKLIEKKIEASQLKYCHISDKILRVGYAHKKQLKKTKLSYPIKIENIDKSYYDFISAYIVENSWDNPQFVQNYEKLNSYIKLIFTAKLPACVDRILPENSEYAKNFTACFKEVILNFNGLRMCFKVRRGVLLKKVEFKDKPPIFKVLNCACHIPITIAKDCLYDFDVDQSDEEDDNNNQTITAD